MMGRQVSPAARAALDPRRVHDRTTGLVDYQREPISRVTPGGAAARAR